MIEIGFGIMFVSFIVFMAKFIYPAIRLANELKATYKNQGYYFPEEWE